MKRDTKTIQTSSIAHTFMAVAWLCSVMAYATDDRHAQRHPYEGYTRPFRTIRVAAADAGRVDEVLIDRGEVVRRGQILVKLDASILRATRKIAEAEAAATAHVDGLRVEYQLRQRRLAQFQALVESGRGSSEEVLRAHADEQVALFNLHAAEEEQAKRQLKLGEIDARIQARQVTSPIEGVVTDVVYEVGEFVSLNDPQVATLVDLQKLRASFFLPTREAVRVHPNQSVQLTLVELGSVVTATVEYVDPTTQADSGRVRIDVVIDNQDGKHRSGLRCLLERPSFLVSERAISP